MTRRWRMAGTQEVRLPDGRTVAPGAGEFEADLEHLEEFFLRVGAVVPADVAPAPAGDAGPAEDEGRRPRRQRE